MISNAKLIGYFASFVISGLYFNQKVLLNFFNGSGNSGDSPLVNLLLIVIQQFISFCAFYCSLKIIARLKSVKFQPKLNVFLVELSRAKYPHALVILWAFLGREFESQGPVINFSLVGLIFLSVILLGYNYLAFASSYLKFKWYDSLCFIVLLVVFDYLVVGLSSVL